MLNPPSWAERALCNDGPDDATWFPDERVVGSTKYARQTCKACPVTNECLEYALSLGPTCLGIWGGTTERQRGKLRTLRRAEGPFHDYHDQENAS
ncbi:hypothetical protein GCM10027053_51650 [Intrasporangium mesophilum]